MRFPLGIKLTVWAGPGLPLPLLPPLLLALEKVEVEEREQAPATCEVTFRAPPSPLVPLNPLVNSPQLAGDSRLVVAVTTGVVPSVLFNGVIQHRQFAEDGSCTVICEDLSVLMAKEEVAKAHMGMSLDETAQAILMPYASKGLIAKVIPPTPSPPAPQGSGQIQRASDRDYLLAIAAQVGHVFYIKPGLSPVEATAFWGPRVQSGSAQPALTVGPEAYRNVESINFAYSPNELTTVDGKALDLQAAPQSTPVQTTTTGQVFALAAKPALVANAANLRKSRVNHGGSNPMQTTQLAQAKTRRSSWEVATAEGKLDVLRYGHVLRAHGLVGLRGAGTSWDGLWYVASVTHTVEESGKYTQTFKLTREGLFPTVPLVKP